MSINRILQAIAMALAVANGFPVCAADEQTIQRGRAVFTAWCASCHGPNDQSPGTTALQAKYKGQKPAALEQRDDLPPEFVGYFVRNGISIMPFFRKTEISDADLKDLTAYLAEKKK